MLPNRNARNDQTSGIEGKSLGPGKKRRIEKVTRLSCLKGVRGWLANSRVDVVSI